MYPLRRYSGYPTFSTSPFPISALLDGDAFPFSEVLELEAYGDFGEQSFAVGTENPIIELPFINFGCLGTMGYNVTGCTSVYNRTVEVNRTEEIDTLRGFTETQYDAFRLGTTTDGSPCGGRNLVFNVEPGVSPRPDNVGPCADLNVQCR